MSDKDTLKLEIETSIYNENRYSKPWIAHVDFEVSTTGEFNFGDWIGEHGYEGTLILICVKVGDIVARGQKDYRKPKNSAPEFYYISESGELEYIGTRGAAYKYYKEKIKEKAHEQNI